MPFKYACFISYRHGQEEIVSELCESLRKELRYWLDVEVYLDDERLKGGDFFDAALARALCESVCMIIVYTPTYFSQEHTFCAREFSAMEKLEAERLQALGASVDKQHSLIIPIVYRGAKWLPDRIRGRRQYYDFEALQLGGLFTTSNEYKLKIKEIAEYIKERFEELDKNLTDDPCRSCDEFNLPDEAEVHELLEAMLRPKPKLPGREALR